MSSKSMLSLSLNQKVRATFGNLAFDKRRLMMSQIHQHGIPSYVAEWILDTIVPGEGPLTPDEQAKLKEWMDKYVPGPNDQRVIKYRLSQGERVRLLTPVEVEVDLTRVGPDKHFAKMPLLNIREANIHSGLLEKYPELLRQGMWGVVELTFQRGGGDSFEDNITIIENFRPMQATVDLNLFKEIRREFTLEEWRALLLISMGYLPDAFTEEQKTLLLARLLPLVQKNLHLMELAPKGTGKSYIYENLSPRIRLVSGGNVSPAVLFVNNRTHQWGLLARFAVVVLDEVHTLRFDSPAEVMGGLKGYLANGRLTRGGLNEASSDCSFVMLANIQLNSNQLPVNEVFVGTLPPFLREAAFLDRLRGIIPGWKIPKLQTTSLINVNSSLALGLKSDFFGEVLYALRNETTCDQYCAANLTADRLYKRNVDSVQKLASAFMKLQFPHGEVSDEEFRCYCVEPAIELREIVWDQLRRIDPEYLKYDA